MIKVVPQNFFPNIWGSPPFKFLLRPKTARQNGVGKNLNACKIQITGSRDFKYGLKWPPVIPYYDTICFPKFSYQCLGFPGKNLRP